MTTGLRERKRTATRAALHRAALELVSARGLDAVSVDEVAEAAGVAPRTFFNHWPGKDDAVLGIDPAEVGELAARVLDRPATETPVQAVRAVAAEQAAGMAADAPLWRLRMQVVEAHPALRARLAATFDRSELAMATAVATRTGGDPHDLYPLLLAGASAAAMRSVLQAWLASDFTASLPALVDQAWDLLAAGLPAPR